MTGSSDTTFVLTSCGRFDLLAETMLTFLACNTAPIARHVVVEDSGSASVRDVLGGLDVPIDILLNQPPVGQMASIDAAYATVATLFVFHCEDDWRFLRGGFVEESRAVLDARDDVSVVVCRRNGQNVDHDALVASASVERVAGVGVRIPRLDAHPLWGGYTFNPGLRRHADWERAAPLAAYRQEAGASLWFKSQRMRCAFLEEPACETTGQFRHVRNARTPKSPELQRMEALAARDAASGK
ncbi:MAG: glycosyltransferase family 2 protein [Betaproteobacteria bacterium]